MTFPTYSYGDPANNPIHAVRYKIRDTDTNAALLSDEEIAYELTQAGGDVLLAAISCCTTIIAWGARKVTRRIGDTVIQYSDLVENYVQLKERLLEDLRLQELMAIPTIGEVDDGDASLYTW